MRAAENIVRKPLLTEKGTQLRETGGHDVPPAEEELRQKILFEVARDANKIEIQQAVEELFNVKVESVRTMVVRGKVKRLGRFEGKRPNWKKAIVTLAPGETIEFFEGV